VDLTTTLSTLSMRGGQDLSVDTSGGRRLSVLHPSMSEAECKAIERNVPDSAVTTRGAACNWMKCTDFSEVTGTFTGNVNEFMAMFMEKTYYSGTGNQKIKYVNGANFGERRKLVGYGQGIWAGELPQTTIMVWYLRLFYLCKYFPNQDCVGKPYTMKELKPAFLQFCGL